MFLLFGGNVTAQENAVNQKPEKEVTTKQEGVNQVSDKQSEKGSAIQGKVERSQRETKAPGEIKKVKEVKGARPQINRGRKGARPTIERPAGTGRPAGAGRPGGAARPEKPIHPNRR